MFTRTWSDAAQFLLTKHTERVHAGLAAGAGEPQRARGAASLDPSRPVVVSEKVVRRLMREEGLAAASSASRARRYSSCAGEEGMAAAPNLLLLDASRDLHEFRAPAPGLVFATDITEFRLPGEARKLYLSPMVDLYDGRVAAWAASDSPNKAPVRAMLERGAAAFAGATAVLHSDSKNVVSRLCGNGDGAVSCSRDRTAAS